MTPLLSRCCLSIVLLLGTATAFANDHDDGQGQGRRESRGEDRHVERQPDRQTERLIERVRQTEIRQANIDAQNQADSGRKPGRMTPEERRALRRQINEAGQDIYTRQR